MATEEVVKEDEEEEDKEEVEEDYVRKAIRRSMTVDVKKNLWNKAKFTP